MKRKEVCCSFKHLHHNKNKKQNLKFIDMPLNFEYVSLFFRQISWSKRYKMNACVYTIHITYYAHFPQFICGISCAHKN